MKIVILAIALLPLLLSANLFGQGASSLGGTVMDVSQAVLPGASVVAINTQTGVETSTAANNAGIYNFPSLQPGVYNVVATMDGFQKATKTDVRLGLAAQIRLNFELVVAGVETEVEVTTSAENLVLESGSSTGTVLAEESVTELPLVSNDVMDLINIMGGVVKAENPIFGNQNQTFAGVPGSNINIQRDGISVNEIRYNSGIVSPSRINTEMVGEFKMILSPVDAEMGRGAGQVQMITKSGANAFHGSGVWNIQNTALDAYEWENKDQANVNPRAWRNLNNYTLSASGPIIKNKTFFFATWDQQIVRSKTSVVSTVLTNCARKGIYRYLDDVRIGNANQDPSVTAEYPPPTYTATVVGKTRAAVNTDGSVRETYTWPNEPTRYYSLAGVTETNELRFNNVLGPLTPAEQDLLSVSAYSDCADYMPNYEMDYGETAWDQYRTGYDKSGLVERFSAMMPPVNSYDSGDGLNYAGHRWTRTLKGSDTVFGSGEDNLRKSITVKIDHNINSAHRVSGTYAYETDKGEDAFPYWPSEYNGYGGLVDRQPQTFTVSLTSTLKPTLLNEFRMGLSRTRTHTNEPLSNPTTGDELREVLMTLLPTDDAEKFPRYTGYPILAGPGTGSILFHPEGGAGHPYGSRGNLPTTWGGVDPRWTFSDTITWMRGAHSFKGGFEFRRNKSWQEQNGLVSFSGGANTFPSIKGGTVSGSPYRDYALSSWEGMPEIDEDYRSGTAASGNYSTAYALMTYMAGSVGDISQYFFVTDAKNPRWNNAGAGELSYISDLRNREFSFFFKDDWKVSSSLTLNLGMRYEYYGVPWVDSGLTAGVRDGVRGMFGMSGGDFSTWMPENPQESAYRTEQIFIGPNSLNPDIAVFNKDQNNFAPHIGFAWQLPWFGKGKTTLRGGYSVSYMAVSNFDNTMGYAARLANAPGMTYAYQYRGHAENPYLDFDNIGTLLPLYDPQVGFIGAPPDEQPAVMGTGTVQPVEKRDQALTIYDPDIRNPYIQNLTMSLTRNVGNNITVDLRYIGTLSRKSISGLNLNTANYINNGLQDELKSLREGTPSAMLDAMILPGTLYVPTPGGVADLTLTGSQQVLQQYSQQMANGDFLSIAQSLATTNGDKDGYLGVQPSTVRGAVLRYSGTPENLIYANPQYSSATVQMNMNHSNYHSMQAQVTMRPTRGLSFQTSYTWSRNLARQGITDYREIGEDYWLSGQHRSHSLSSYGTWDLPFGANGFVFRNASGAVKKAIEGWQLSWIASMTSGIPMSISGLNTLWGNAAMDLVGPFDTKSGKVTWEPGAATGRYFGDTYMAVVDPICSTGAVDDALIFQPANWWESQGSLQTKCAGTSGLRALALVAGYDENGSPIPGDIVFQNAEPGTRPNFQGNNLTGPGRWSLDMAMSKSIEFMEGKRIDFRVDAQNIFNHPTPSYNMWKGFGSYELSDQVNARFTQINNPSVGIGPWTPFGYINSKSGHRTFQAKVRISF